VQIVVEEVRQRVLSGSVDDGRIRNLLLAASREANDPGVRVETMSLLKSQMDSTDVRRALLAALRNDTNPGVRLKALEALRNTEPDNDTRRVLSEVLLTDDNPGVRTQAIDLLVQTHERSTVGVCQELMTRESNDYVRLKCQRALTDMKASVETF
jgi:HEAT repeat protein